MKYVISLVFLLLLGINQAQQSYSDLIKNGKGEVSVGFYNFSNEDNEVNDNGFEYKIMELFFDYVETKKQVKINRIYTAATSFKGLYKKVKQNNFDFGYCYFSITNERKQEVNFSPAYMSNIEVLISNKSLPIVLDTNGFVKAFRGATGIYIPETTYEEDLFNLKKEVDVFHVEKISSSTQLVAKINNTPNYFGFVELQQFFDLKKEFTNIKRQNVFLRKREGYGFIYEKPSDWKPIVDLFYIEKYNEIRAIIRARFDGEMLRFIDNIKGSEGADVNLLLLTKERELTELRSQRNKLLYDNEKIENEKSKASEKIMGNYLSIVTLMSILVILVIIIAYRIKVKKGKEILLKNQQLAIQKNLVELKHKEITSSITYAKRIQKALLQKENSSTPDFSPHFIYFQPKDVVSGDFYWSKNFENHYYLSVTDCTGHGVPGGFMSMLGIVLLNEIIRSEKKICPKNILDLWRKNIIEELHQTKDFSSSRDGMNTAILKIDKASLTMSYAGAYHTIIIIRDNQIIELKTDKEPIGFTYIMTPFSNFEFQLKKGDLLYLYTDGFVDQFGGERGKKFKSRQFKELLLSINTLSLIKQKSILKETFNSWKGKEEQVDDVTVVGMRVQ